MSLSIRLLYSRCIYSLQYYEDDDYNNIHTCTRDHFWSVTLATAGQDFSVYLSHTWRAQCFTQKNSSSWGTAAYTGKFLWGDDGYTRTRRPESALLYCQRLHDTHCTHATTDAPAAGVRTSGSQPARKSSFYEVHTLSARSCGVRGRPGGIIRSCTRT